MFGSYRTLLALAVVACHLGGWSSSGPFAVFAFYSLSGYLMTRIMAEVYGYNRIGVLRYAINRALRIFPNYWFSAALSITAILLLGATFVQDFHALISIPERWVHKLQNAFLVLSPAPWPPRLTPPAWALTVELFNYALIALGLSKTAKTSWIWLFFGLGYHLYTGLTNEDFLLRYSTLAASALPFSLGALSYHYQHWFAALRSKYARINNYTPLIAFGLMTANAGSTTLGAPDFEPKFYVNILLGTLCLGLMIDKPLFPKIKQQIDEEIGALSYPIYLIHYQVGIFALAALTHTGIETSRPSLLLLMVATPLIILMARVMNLSIDKPIERLRKSIKTTVKDYP